MEALFFIDHVSPHDQQRGCLSYPVAQFLGDIGQPLHVEALEFGGNEIRTTCNGVETNLHATWDTGMMGTTCANSTIYLQRIIQV